MIYVRVLELGDVIHDNLSPNLLQARSEFEEPRGGLENAPVHHLLPQPQLPRLQNRTVELARQGKVLTGIGR